MKILPQGIELIKHFESLHDGDLRTIGIQPKMDPIGIWTIGWGHAIVDPATNKYVKGPGGAARALQLFPDLTTDGADLLLSADLLETSGRVKAMLTREIDDWLFTAATSFTFNCGTHYKNSLGVMKPYKLWSLLNDPATKSADLYEYWRTSVVKAGGQYLKGLERRRRAEAMLGIYHSLQFEWKDL